MEAFAALQIEKKKKLIEIENQKNLTVKNVTPELGHKDKIALNKQQGFPIPPFIVSALGKSESAAVWWVHENDSLNEADLEEHHKIQKWIIKRYRKDKDGEWRLKGSSELVIFEKNQYLVTQLSNYSYYKFTVSSVTSRGTSFESEFSNVVMVEPPLPVGWFRFYDNQRARNYYANLRTKQSSWIRPDLDPYFLPEAFFFDFKKNEIAFLKELYREEYHHLNVIKIEQLSFVLSEVGEKLPTWQISQLIKSLTCGQEIITNFQVFMALMQLIKKSKTKQTMFEALSSSLSRSFGWLARRSEGVAFKMQRLGDWELVFDDFTGRYFYLHKHTQEKQWEMPEDVRHFISESDMKKMLRVFDYSQVERVKQYFDMLDVDHSGQLPFYCLRLLTHELHIGLTDRMFRKLMASVDRDKSGTIEYDEFCWMLRKLVTGRSGIWQYLSFKQLIHSVPIPSSLSSLDGLSQQSSSLAIADILQSFGNAVVTLATKLEEDPSTNALIPDPSLPSPSPSPPFPTHSPSAIYPSTPVDPSSTPSPSSPSPESTLPHPEFPQTSLVPVREGELPSPLPYQLADDQILEDPLVVASPPPSYSQTLQAIRSLAGLTQFAAIPQMILRTFSREGGPRPTPGPTPTPTHDSLAPGSENIHAKSGLFLGSLEDGFDHESQRIDEEEGRGRERECERERESKGEVEGEGERHGGPEGGGLLIDHFPSHFEASVHSKPPSVAGSRPSSSVVPVSTDLMGSGIRVYKDEDFDEESQLHPPTLLSNSLNTSSLGASTFTLQSTVILPSRWEQLRILSTTMLQGTATLLRMILLLLFRLLLLVVITPLIYCLKVGFSLAFKSLSSLFFKPLQAFQDYFHPPEHPHGNNCFCGCRSFNKVTFV